MKPVTFSKLTVTNSWEFLTYHLDGVVIPGDRGGKVDVRFPDGTVLTGIPYTSKTTTAWCSDHGHEYRTPQHRLYFHADLHGLKVPINLCDVEVANLRPGKGKK